MYKRFLTILAELVCVILTFTSAYSQPSIFWTKTYGGEAQEEGRSVIQTDDGGFIIAGWTDSFGQPPQAASNIWLLKLNVYGDTLWTKTYGGSEVDIVRSVRQTKDGGYILAGYTESFGAGNRDVYLVKTDAYGETIWTKTYGGNGADEAYDVVQTHPDDGYAVIGYEASFAGGGADVWLLKTDTNGDSVWSTFWSTSQGEWGRSVQQTLDGGYIMTGSTFSAGPNEADIFLIKTNNGGTIQWTKFFGGGGVNHSGTVQETSEGGFIIAGWSTFHGAGGKDIYLIKTDINGDTLWTKTFGGSADDGCDGYSLVQQTMDGGYIVAGWTYSFGSGGADIWLIKTDSQGDSMWAETYGGTKDDLGWSVQQTADEGYIVTGTTNSHDEGNSDIWVQRFTDEYPKIIDVKDIANDQGRQVRVSWKKSGFDGVDDNRMVRQYSLWRRVDPLPKGKMGKKNNLIDNPMDYSVWLMKAENYAFPSDQWDFIQTVPAIGSETYNIVAATLADSTRHNGMHWSVFTVIAHTADPLVFYTSGPDSGYSLDNLLPNAPSWVIAKANESAIALNWDRIPDQDFDYYAIYRSTQGGFNPAPMEPYATTIDTFFTDTEINTSTTYYYVISAFDFSGNQGAFSNEVSVNITGLDNQYPVATSYALFQYFPNPFIPTTTIAYQLPRSGHVTLKMYNSLGQKVAILVNKKQAAGKYEVKWDAAHFDSGIYFSRFESGGFVEIKKLILLK